MPLAPRPLTPDEAAARTCCGPQYQNVNLINLKDCAGPKCMAWRWVKPLEEPTPKVKAGDNPVPPIPLETAKPTHGVCGYIGE